jgi:hypothetical protein
VDRKFTFKCTHSTVSDTSRSPRRGKLSKKSKRPRSLSPSGSSSDEDRRRKERKEKKRSRKEKDSERRRHRSRSRRKSYDDDDSEDDRRKSRSKRSKSKSRSKSKDIRPRSPTPDDMEDDWVVKPVTAPLIPVPSDAKYASPDPPPSSHVGDEADSDDEVGPQPIQRLNASKRIDERSYGGALLRGEGSAMAAFLQDGTESRIPRRGEIGLTSDEIAKYEDVGYVMSGSRHRRMNAVRMRKENQVISAEEKRGILKLQKEERERREAILREEFNELVNERLKAAPESRPK